MWLNLDFDEINTALDSTWKYIQTLGISERFIIGLDTEWDVDMRRGGGKIGNTSLIQLALKTDTFESVFLLQSKLWTKPPIILKFILEDPRVKLAGNRIRSSDGAHLTADFGFQFREDQFIKLNHLCFEKGYIPNRVCSLKRMTEVTLGYRLDKDLLLRNGGWSNKVLSHKQIQYAARDAWSSLLIALELQYRPTKKSMDNATVSPLESPTTPEHVESSTSPDEILPPQQTMGIKEDIFHFMQRITRLTPKRHPLSYIFSLKFSEAVFLFDIKDKEELNMYLTANENTTFEKKWMSNPDWVLKRTKRIIPQPLELEKRLLDFIEEFKKEKWTHEIYGSILTLAAEQKLLSQIRDHVRKGCISDPKGVAMYAVKGRDSNGLTMYRCLRGGIYIILGTNSVELWHQFLEMRFSSWQAGPEFAMHALLLLVNRRNVRMSERNRPNFPKFGHYDHHLIEQIQEVYQKLFLEQRFALLPKKKLLCNEGFGIVPFLPLDQQEQVDKKAITAYPPSLQFMAIQQKTLVPYIGIYGREEKVIWY